ncbi:MAG: hypothetical protein LBB45_00345 [Methanobrevibacter sp.]|nr:hypothetical protein [Candidatus Methanovirga basalitermitum]
MPNSYYMVQLGAGDLKTTILIPNNFRAIPHLVENILDSEGVKKCGVIWKN